MHNWEKCQDGDLRFVNRDEKSTKSDLVRFENLQNQYLERYGMSDELEQYLKIKEHLIKLKLAYVETGDRMILNQIKIEEHNLHLNDPNRHEGMTISQCVVHLSKWMGQWINKRKITIVDFKEMMNEYVRSNKKK